MKQSIFTILLISAIGLVSCRKDKFEPDIKQYDQIQIQNYITSNGLTGMIQDTTGHDSTGIYYKILNPGSGTAYDYPDKIAFVFTIRSFDGKYISTDTIANHFFDYVGHIDVDGYPVGLQIAVHNILKYPGASMRVLIPSHLAYGVNGSGSGSSQVANNRIAGNQCLDYYVHAINNFQVYDDMVIQNFMKSSNMTGYIPVKIPVPVPVDPSVYWVGKNSNPPVPDSAIYYYKILTPATSTDAITDNSTITATYTGQLFNGTIFDSDFNGDNPYTGPVDSFIAGVRNGLESHASVGTKISLLIPSSLGYGVNSSSGITSFSCLRFTWVITAVTP